ncbi:MAG: anthranilate phosphoribosyltransferase [Betaproteobacteria bacterium RBG_16_58_11]|nr:MAG: anthranilate phosphoribosyltransferase [Betaproteobacteria bacterium RBG_16_58_11]
MTPQQALTVLIEKRDLTRDEMLSVMQQIMGGELTPVQIAGILVALRAKGETVTEIAAAAQVMRELSTKVPVTGTANLVDTCGTGGDGAHTFNISTASAFVAAAAGVKVAKHGGRSVSSTCGSADVLEALGVNVNLTPEQVAQAVHEIGVGFMFAPNHHSAMKHAAPVRRELGVRTLFNLLGPMTNPAGAQNQVMGVFHRDLVPKLARVLQQLGSRHVLVVHAADGLDEISLGGDTYVAELREGDVSEYTLNPQQFGLDSCSSEKLAVHNIDEARAMLLSVFDNRDGPAKDIVALNAGAAIYVGGAAATLQEGIAKAQAAIESGAAKAKLEALVVFSQRFVKA